MVGAGQPPRPTGCRTSSGETSTAPDNGVGGGVGSRTVRRVADDGEVIELVAPLPGLAGRATIRFMTSGEGLLDRSRPTSRIEAAHAVLRLEFGDREAEERRLELAEVEPYLAEVRAFQAGVAAKRAENLATQKTPEEHAAARAERSARIRPTCAHCGVAREHRGTKHVVTAANPQQITRDDPGYWGSGFEDLVLYVCPQCGSAELFAPGGVDHPLGG